MGTSGNELGPVAAGGGGGGGAYAPGRWSRGVQSGCNFKKNSKFSNNNLTRNERINDDVM